jgi:hypothetical protein
MDVPMTDQGASLNTGVPTQYSGFSPDLRSFDLPVQMVRPLLLACHQVNTLADTLFYDVGLLWLRLYTRGVYLSTQMTQPTLAQESIAAWQAAAQVINLDASANPEGAILVVDAHHAPFVQKYDNAAKFLESNLKFPSPANAQQVLAASQDIHVITVTGVGSSALGSAAFAWNVSEALREPVAAIIPGYGLADLMPQALGGWFGFGAQDLMRRFLQHALLNAAPEVALIGNRHASPTNSGHSPMIGDAVFRGGSPESDILHEILTKTPKIRRLYGHSKGCLCIQNAIRDLPEERYRDLHVTTFGCTIQEEKIASGVDYNQILGRIDGLGQLNSWGNWPDEWIQSWHSTNSLLPQTMAIADLVKKDVEDEIPVPIDMKKVKAALIEALKEVSFRNGSPTA